MKYVWNNGVLRKKGAAKPAAREQHAASPSEAFAEKQA